MLLSLSISSCRGAVEAAKMYKHRCTHLFTTLSPIWKASVRWLRTSQNVYVDASRLQSFHKLNPFGRVVIRNVRPVVVKYQLTYVNPQEHPDQDVAFLSVSDDDVIESHMENNVLTLDNQLVDSRQVNKPVQCQIEVPVKFDVDAELSGISSICITNLENATLSVGLDSGECYLCNIQTGQFHLQSKEGPIISEKLLQGNGVITTCSGTVSLHKVLSQILHIQSHTGHIKITNLYANTSDLSTTKGSIHIVNSHMDTRATVKEEGNIKIESISGSLEARTQIGDVEVSLSDHDKVVLSTGQGDVTINIPSTLSTCLEVKGNKIEVSEGLLLKNVTEDELNGQESLEAFIEGIDLDHSGTGSIVASTSNGTIKIVASEGGWLSKIQENLRKK